MRLANLKRASFWLPFFYAPLFYGLLIPSSFAANPCDISTAQNTAERVSLKQVVDGDTLRLSSGELIRIVGLNTPETGKRDRPAEPIADNARDALQDLLGNHLQIYIVNGVQKKDRYKRRLAHVFTVDGRNISEYMLHSGMGFMVAIAPNFQFHDCYVQAELKAQQAGRGVWSHSYYAPRQAVQLTRKDTGFRQISGKVSRIGFSSGAVWLNMGTGFSLKISRRDMKYFPGTNWEDYRGKTLVARGWVYYRNNQLRMKISHPAMLRRTH